jgi:hypothetical protein
MIEKEKFEKREGMIKKENKTSNTSLLDSLSVLLNDI